jgi:hypothetical protein
MMHLKKALIVFAILFAATFQLFAQPGDPQTDPDNAVPITGLEWLLAGGAALGVKKLLSSRKNASAKE